MKIIRKLQETVSLVDFADEYGLDMVIERIRDEFDYPPFSARLDGVEDKAGRCLLGWGSTEGEAINAYAREISFKNLVINRLLKEPVVVRLAQVVYFHGKK